MVKIITLGDFDIRIDDKSILQSIGNQHRLIKLFKYFITFNGKKLLPENIIEDIWEEENFKEPLNVLRTQISRLRNMIDFKKLNIEPFFHITFIDGYYLFKLHKNCCVDFLEMESCVASRNKDLDNDEILDVCKRGIDLYKGEYLGELGYEDWLIPVRNRLDRLYVTSLTRYLEKLKEQSMNIHILSICEEAIAYKPYEEIIHIFLIEALISLGQNKCALNHYKYCTTKLYSDLGEAPSNKMKNVYKKIKSGEEKNSVILNLSTVDKELIDLDNLEGVLLCDSSNFKILYRCILRIKERHEDIDALLGIVSIDKSGYREAIESDIKSAMQLLLDIIYRNLRKGDVITKWNENQLLVLLFRIGNTDVGVLIDRIKTIFSEKIKNDKISLNIKFKRI
ncbi:MAG: bacterial transcriptional activator domain-containing protein [Gudongella sp.]|nr:bacterial transcriptional activator domain-containing protein [Gudongella sp.]